MDSARALDDCLVLAGHQIARTGIHVERKYRATLAPAISRQELQLVLVDLIVNAIHAIPKGGMLQLGTRNSGSDTVEIEVADTGSGLSEELMARLFQPFVTRRPDGTGLGLWISRGLVERYGGDIQAASRKGGHSGAVFTVVLRVVAQG